MSKRGPEEAEALAELKRVAALPKPSEMPDRLPLAAIKTAPAVLQPRSGITEYHVETLARAIRSQGALDPLLVIQLGASPYVVDGHHRYAAYGRAKVAVPIPVTYFSGSLEEAVAEAGRANSKAKLPMTNQDRQNFAWRLVRMGGFSKSAIRRAASVSDGQVANMRRVREKLGTGADSYPDWFAAMKASKGENETWTDEDIENWRREKSIKWAEQLSKAWGAKPIQQTDVAAMALEAYFGRRLARLSHT